MTKRDKQSNSERSHIGHHVLAAIAVEGLLLGWDGEKHKPIWSNDAPDKIRQAILEFADE